MAETLYPRGYGETMVTMEELERRYGPSAPIPCHPEFWRRLKAWLTSRGGKIGIGGAYRFTQPEKPGFAPPGMSFHESQRFESGFAGYSAVDLVVAVPGDIHRAPYWSEVPRQGSGHPDIKDFGLHCNVGGEPWHMQCYEIDGYVRWDEAGRFDPQKDYPLPDDVVPPPPPPPPPSYKNDVPKPTLRKGSRGNEVSKLQGHCNFWGWDAGPADGDFGSKTEAGVKRMQAAVKVSQDGVYGPVTADAYDKFITAMQNLDSGEYKPGERTLRLSKPKMRGSDVTWVQQTLKDQGLTITVDGWFGSETHQRVAQMQGWNGLPRTGVVDDATWNVLFKY